MQSALLQFSALVKACPPVQEWTLQLIERAYVIVTTTSDLIERLPALVMVFVRTIKPTA